MDTNKYNQYTNYNSLRKSSKHFLFSKSLHTRSYKIKELQVPVPYGHISIKAWGSSDAFPVLAFHGWQDNCGTFDRLIPMLSDKFYYLAIDYPGHGLSSHKPQGSVCTILDLIMASKSVSDYLGIKKCHMIGHSMGRANAARMTAMYPELVEKLVMIDTVKPISSPTNSVLDCIKKGADEYMRLENNLKKTPPIYTFESAIERLMAGMHQEVTKESAEVLLKRGMLPSPCGKGFIFSRDLRCRPIDIISMICDEQSESFMSNLKCELLVILATNTHPKYQADTPKTIEKFCTMYKKNALKCFVENVEGNHFLHLNSPDRVAPLINNFFDNSN